MNRLISFYPASRLCIDIAGKYIYFCIHDALLLQAAHPAIVNQ
jgi:hypothetical protein